MDYLPLTQELRPAGPGCEHSAAYDDQMGEELSVETQRLASLGQYAGRIAHDFNNLLTPIISAAQLAIHEHSPDQELAGLLDHILTAARRASELSRQMTRYASQGDSARARINLSLLVGEMLPLLRVTLSPDVRLRYEPALAIWLEADLTQLRQVLMNLVVNASEAIGRRPGVITITAGTKYLDPQAQAPGMLEALPEGRYAYLQVSDTGPGIDGAMRARIFEPWFSTKGKGRGVGLNTVRTITRAHGGSLSLVSEPGRGSAFTVWLPLEILSEEAGARGGSSYV